MNNKNTWYKALYFVMNKEKMEGIHFRPEPSPQDLYEQKLTKME